MKRLPVRIARMRKILRKRYHRECVIVGTCAAAVAVLALGSAILGKSSSGDVYAAAKEGSVENPPEFQQDPMPSGIAGIISGVQKTEVPTVPVNRIGTSGEEVIVGQRATKISEVTCLDMSSQLQSVVDSFSTQSTDQAAAPAIMSDTDYDTLLHIVEAEAGGEDLKGKILVANVIMNRAENKEFPDSITEVVWQREGGAAQFSPTEDGRIGTVTVSDDTKEAVRQALEGTDYSQGALFFVAKNQASQTNVNWFESDLKELFVHGVHDFYTFPDP